MPNYPIGNVISNFTILNIINDGKIDLCNHSLKHLDGYKTLHNVVQYFKRSLKVFHKMTCASVGIQYY